MCSATEFQTVVPTTTSDRVCASLTTCGVDPELVAATPTSDRSCEVCPGGAGRFGEINASVAPPLVAHVVRPESACNQISVQQLLTVIAVTKIAIYDFAPRSFSRGNVSLPVGTLELRTSGISPTAWINVTMPSDGSQGLVLATDSVGTELGFRFVPTVGFSGTVTFTAAAYTGPEQSGQFATGVQFSAPSVPQSTFIVNIPLRNVPPTLDEALQNRAFPQADEDPLEDSAGKDVFIHTVLDIVCPSSANCFYSDVDGRVGGVAVVAADTRFGSWSWRCCPQTFLTATDGCPQSEPFTPMALPQGTALGLARNHCEVRFVSIRDFNTEVDHVTKEPRPETDRPSISFRAWDGSGGLSVGQGQAWDPRSINVSAEVARGDDSAIGSSVVPIFVQIRNVIDVPYLNLTSAVLPFTDGQTDIPLAETLSGRLEVIDPDTLGTTTMTVTVQAGDAVTYTLPSAITPIPSSSLSECTGTCIFQANESLPTAMFNSVLQGMRYRPGGSNFSQVIQNRTIVITANDDQLRTILTVVFRNPNLRPTVSILSGDDSNDLQPLGRVDLIDDDQLLTEAIISILNASSSTTFTFAANPNFNVTTSTRGATATYRVTSSVTATSEWQQFLRTFIYAGSYPRRVRVSIRDAEQESFPIVAVYTSSSAYTPPIVDLNGRTVAGVDGDPESPAAFTGAPADVIQSDPYLFVFANASIQRAEVSIVNSFDCPDERLSVPNVSALSALGLESFVRDASAIMLIGSQPANR